MAWLSILFLAITGLHLQWSYGREQVCFLESEHKSYDDELEICCNNDIQPRVVYKECCGGDTIYFHNTHLCCGGKVVDRFSPPKGGKVVRDCSTNETLCHEQICCGDALVDKENTLCCQDKPISLTAIQPAEKSSYICCGDKMINKYTHFCCNDSKYLRSSPLSCCGALVYDINAERCLDNYSPHRVVEKYKNFCGDIEYDTRKNSCCSAILNSIPETDPTDPTKWNQNRGCCDQYVYDTTKEQCCREHHTGFKTHTIPQMENVYCCGDGFYNSAHQDCYNGAVLEINSDQERCGYGYIDGSFEGCCGEVMTYNTNSHECCMGTEFNVISKKEVCCNGVGINNNKLCCEGIEPCEKNNITDDECCYNFKTNSGKTYSSKNNDFCVDGEVMRLPPGARPCTRSNFFYPNSQICCGSRVENISSGYDQCCEDKPYNSKLQQCCNDEVINIPPSEGSCCLKDFKVYRFNDTKNPCRIACSDTTYYDFTKEVCCEGKVHQLNSNTECCGSSAINVDTTECCGETFPLSKTGHMKCCGNKDLYDVRFSKCSKNGKKIITRNLLVRKQSDVQRLCSHTALKHFDGGIKYACESQYAVIGRVLEVQIMEKHSPIIIIKMQLSKAKSVNRGKHFSRFSGQQDIHFTIEVANNNGVSCKRRFLDKFCEVIVFFNAQVKNGHVKISSTSKFFMTRYTRQREQLITRKLSHQFCQDKFNIPNKQ